MSSWTCVVVMILNRKYGACICFRHSGDTQSKYYLWRKSV